MKDWSKDPAHQAQVEKNERYWDRWMASSAATALCFASLFFAALELVSPTVNWVTVAWCSGIALVSFIVAELLDPTPKSRRFWD